MNKGFSDNLNTNKEKDKDKVDNESKKGLAKILSEKKFSYTLPGKRQINIFATIVLALNFFLVIGVILFFNNETFHDFVFNVGR